VMRAPRSSPQVATEASPVHLEAPTDLNLEPAIQSARNWLEIAAALHLINSLVLCAGVAVSPRRAALLWLVPVVVGLVHVPMGLVLAGASQLHSRRSPRLAQLGGLTALLFSLLAPVAGCLALVWLDRAFPPDELARTFVVLFGMLGVLGITYGIGGGAKALTVLSGARDSFG
jgi:hypothetical protein